MSAFVTVETESFLGTSLSFFWGHLWGKLDCVNVHGIWVFHSRRRREGLEGLGSSSTLLSDLFCMVLLVLEVSGLGIPIINFIGDSVKGHDLFHEWVRILVAKKLMRML